MQVAEEELVSAFDNAAVRSRFSSLRSDFVFLDAPGGTQTPDEVADAVARVYAGIGFTEIGTAMIAEPISS